MDVKALSKDTRRAKLRRVKDKLGFSKAIKVLDISKGSMHYYLHGTRKIPDEVVLKSLQHIEEEEFREIAGSVERLKAIGILSQDGTIDYPTALQILALATRDEFLKQAILRFAVEHREELRKMLGMLPADVVFRWDRGFEDFLREQKRKRVRDQATLSYYN